MSNFEVNTETALLETYFQPFTHLTDDLIPFVLHPLVCFVILYWLSLHVLRKALILSNKRSLSREDFIFHEEILLF